MKQLRALAVGAATLILALGLASPAQAAFPIYIKNSVYSSRNLSITATNPASSGNIFAVAPGRAGTGKGLYAPSGCTTFLKLGNGSWNLLSAGRWHYPAYSSTQYTAEVDC